MNFEKWELFLANPVRLRMTIVLNLNFQRQLIHGPEMNVEFLFSHKALTSNISNFLVSRQVIFPTKFSHLSQLLTDRLTIQS